MKWFCLSKIPYPIVELNETTLTPCFKQSFGFFKSEIFYKRTGFSLVCLLWIVLLVICNVSAVILELLVRSIRRVFVGIAIVHMKFLFLVRVWLLWLLCKFLLLLKYCWHIRQSLFICFSLFEFLVIIVIFIFVHAIKVLISVFLIEFIAFPHEHMFFSLECLG